MALRIRFLTRVLVSVCLITALLYTTILPVRPVLAESGDAASPPPQSELAPEPSPQAPATQPTSPPVQRTIYLQSRTFIPGEPDVPALDQLAASGTDRIHVLLQLDFIPRQAARVDFEARGVKLLAYIPDYAWIASIPAANPAAVLAMTGVTWAGEFALADKLSPDIVNNLWGSHNLAPDGTAAVYVALHPDESLATGRALAALHGGLVTGEVEGINLLVVEMPRANIEALAAEDAVQWIESAAPPLTEANDGSRQQIGVDLVQAAPYNLNGTNIDVLVYDSGQVGAHTDFGARLIHGDSDSVSEHSTHVAGTLGGSGANSAAQGGTALQWRGMAPAVDLISYGTGYSGSGYLFYENVPDIQADWAAAQNTYGADLGSASLGSNIYSNYAPTGCTIMGRYGASAVLIDQIVRGGNSAVGIGDKYIAAWAVGNERGWTNSCSILPGGYGLIAPPAAAKNPIHVGGANTNNNTQYAHTSWGPTGDSRLKPIVTAGACQTTADGGIKSTDNNPLNAYTVMCGTSMATPAVAGGIALMLQHYRSVYNTSGNFWPSTAKAILMQTATDMGNPGPDYQWGYGLVNIRSAVDLIARRAFRQDNVAQGGVDLFTFVVPSNATPATVSLAWDDFEATFNANPTLINNLDLELVAPSGTIWRPWVLDPANPASNATRGVDNRNNQEQVQVPAPEVGTWLVRVKGTTVPQGPQDYTLVCEGCKPLDLGVCQNVAGGMAMASGGATDPDALGAAGMSIQELLDALAAQQPSVGEMWQRALEAAPVSSDEALAIRQAQVQSAVDALEAARAEGTEAVSALGDNLPPPALDLVIDEIAAARERLPQEAPPEVPAVSEAEELDIVRALGEGEAASRALALTDFSDPAEGGSQDSSPEQTAVAGAGGLFADRTVGNGCTYATLAAAIAAASPGDRLLVEGGRTFAENITIPMTLTLQGGYPGCASASSARTTLDGSASGPVVVVNRAISVSLRSLNITNGSTGFEGGGIRFAWGDGTGTLNLSSVSIYGNTGQWGGGLWVGPNARVFGNNVEIYNNTAAAFGGGVRLYGGHIALENSSIHDNSAPLGGGLYATQEQSSAPAVSLSDSDVYYNQALSGDGLGGGVYLRQGTLSMVNDSDLIGNNAIYGGGAYVVTGTLTVEGTSSWIYNNTATMNGGGVAALGSTVYLRDSAQLYSNTAQSGGGAYLDDSGLYCRKAAIRYNTAASYGGGVYATNGSMLDMDLGSYPCLGVRCSRLSSNTATTNYGGGAYLNNSTADLRNTFIEHNSANYGGGVYAFDSSTVYLYNSLMARNDAVSGTGDAIRLNSSSTLTGAGNTLAYNNAGGAATGQAVGLSTSSLSLHCSIIWGHTSSINTAGQVVTYSDIQGGYAGVGNLNTDPLFIAPASGDYHLQNASPVIDRCVLFSGMGTDFENEVRPIVRYTAATPYDMGADEVSGVARVGVNGACSYGTIQQAVNAAQNGDTVRIAEGVFFETVDITDKNITLEGGYNSTCTSYITGTTRIEGSVTGGSVLDISSSVVIIRNLDIAWGNGIGGGVDALSNAQITLDNVDILKNSASYAAGIYVSTSSAVTLTNGSRLYSNNATTSEGGGARVWGQLSAVGEDSDIYLNCASSGGAFYVPGGQLTIEQADVFSNQAAAADGKGGGIYVINNGTASLRNNVGVGTSLFLPNQSAQDGAGIYADNSTVTLDGVNLGGNIATRNGGGLYLGNNSILQAVNSKLGHTISFIGTIQWGNTANYGGGLYADGSTVDLSGAISTNTASYSGGGIYASNSVLHLTDATVGLAGGASGNRLGTSGNTGAGLYLANNTTALLSNTVVISNTFQTSSFTYGGGIYATAGTDLTLQNSRIEQHLAPSAGDGRGAGIYLDGSTATLDNSQILTNTAGAVGGAVRMWQSSSLTVRNGSVIAGNQSLNGGGGGIAADGTPSITITDSVMRNNIAASNGGAIYSNNGVLNVARTHLHHNRALSGGAIYQTGSSAAGTVENTLLHSNTSTSGFGAGIGSEAGAFRVNHGTLADNLNGAGYAQINTTGYVTNSIAWGNAAGGFVVTGGSLNAVCSIDQSGNAGPNINPLFVAPGAGADYHLLNGSPAIDTCVSGLSPDLDNVQRPRDNGYDMGAYEYYLPKLYLPLVRKR